MRDRLRAEHMHKKNLRHIKWPEISVSLIGIKPAEAC